MEQLPITTERQGKLVTIQDLLSTQQLHLPVNSNDVELTDEEVSAAITDAKNKKSIWLEAQRRKELANQQRMENAKPWSMNELWKVVKWRGDQIIKLESGKPDAEFKILDFQKPVIKALLFYFTNNPEFEKLDTKEYNEQELPFDLNKGIWLWGVPGVGKTLLMDMFRINKKISYGLVQCPKLAFAFSKEGEKILEAHTRKTINGEIFSSTPFLHEFSGICYNDLGTEPIPVGYYTTKMNLMEHLILTTYDKKVPFWHRFVTTNLKADQLLKVYGPRFTDRMKQMFNIIDLNGPSQRK